MARRIEERNNAKAEGFALKVPDYDPTTARSLSEQEFLQLFREEAGALLGLPTHENLARAAKACNVTLADFWAAAIVIVPVERAAD